MLDDLHILAGRGPFRATTEFINRNIFNQLELRPEDRFVDIGCGHGLLLQLAIESGVQSAIGLNASEEEVRPLRALGLDVRKGLVDSVPLPDAFASVVVCNSVLLLIPENKMVSSLREIARISEADARVWIGEIPCVDETKTIPKHETVPQMLWWLLRKRGIRSFVGMCRKLLTGAQRGPVLVNKFAAVFFSSPQEFIKMAEEAGLQIERFFPHQTLDKKQQPCASTSRQDYVFRKK